MAGHMQLPNRGKRARSFRQNSVINVTPLVDVMLVLLIIFMITAPMMTVGVQVELPHASAAQTNSEKDPIVVSIDAKGGIYIQDAAVAKEKIVEKLASIIKSNSGAVVYVRGDKSLSYGAVMDIMNMIIEGGITKVALITESA